MDPVNRSVGPERLSVSLGALGRLRLALNDVKLYRKMVVVASGNTFQNKSFATTTFAFILKSNAVEDDPVVLDNIQP